MPQLLSLSKAFKRSKPRIKGSFELAELLSDVGMNMWDRGLNKDGESLLKTAIEILGEIDLDPDGPLRANIGLVLGLLTDVGGISQREASLQYRQRAFEIRQKMFDSIPPKEVTKEDEVLYHNALNDLSCSYQQFNRFNEIAENCNKCFAQYKKRAEVEEDEPYEYGKYYHQMAFVWVYRNQPAKATEFAKRTWKLMSMANEESLIALMYRYDWAVMLFQNGELELSIQENEEVLVSRISKCGKTNSLTLQSYVTLGILHYHGKDFTQAE
jgi:hypothetical protein